MSIRTIIFLIVGIFNSLWLARVYLVLYLYGSHTATESIKWVALSELVACLVLVGLGIERLMNLREKRKEGRHVLPEDK